MVPAAFNASIALGITRYCRLAHRRLIFFQNDATGLTRALAAKDHLIGLIHHLSERTLLDRLAASGVRAVSVSSRFDLRRLAAVVPDNREVGRAAARHLLDRGFKQFGFVGMAEVAFSEERLAGFRQALSAAGHSCASLVRATQESDRELERWLEGLPKPVAVFCCNDGVGQQVCEACLDLEIHVPEQIALVGADDTVNCELTQPPLSSVTLPLETIGYEAAAMLCRMARHGTRGSRVRRLPPLGLTVRQSSDLVAVADPEVSAALRVIREKTADALQVVDVLNAVHLSRRSLELRFSKSLGRSIHQAIMAARLDRARELLAKSRLPIASIARHAGFNSIVRLSTVFRREVGVSPSDYRRRSQNESLPP